jgi:hypothetical protein
MDALKKIDEFIFRILSNLLFKIIPEYQIFCESENKKNDFSNGVYLFMNEFALFLSNEIEKEPTSTVVNNSFIFINKVGESNNLEVLNILKIGVLEILYTSKGIDRKLVSDCLSEKLKKYFQEFSKYYY